MSAYEKIKNPETGRYVSIYGKLGKKVLSNYLDAHQYGGATSADAFCYEKTGWTNSKCKNCGSTKDKCLCGCDEWAMDQLHKSYPNMDESDFKTR